MIISCRDKAILKLAESPNAYPWNVSPESKLEGRGGERSLNDNPPQNIVKLKVRKDIWKRLKGKEKSLVGLNGLNAIQTIPKNDNKGKPENAKKERKD